MNEQGASQQEASEQRLSQQRASQPDGTNYRKLNQQIEAVRSRADEIKDKAVVRNTAVADPLLMDALEELSTALEALQVTEEELYVQHEELIMTRERLENQRQRYQDLFENAPDGYIVTDLIGNIQQANRAASRLLNIRQDHLPNKPFFLYFSEADRGEFHNTLAHFVQQGVSQPERVAIWEAMLVPRKEAQIVAELTITVIYSDTGQPIALRWLIRDMTQRRQMEQQLRDLNANLEHRVRERTELLQTETSLKDTALSRAKASRDEAEALRDIGNILSSTLDLSDVLEKILENVGRLVHHDGGDILLLEDQTVTAALCIGYPYCSDQKLVHSLHFSVQETFPLNEIAQSGSAYIINAMDEPTVWMKALGMSFTARSYIGVPIFAQDILIGFLNLTNAIAGYYSSDELEMLEAFSAQASVAIQNAQLYNQAKTVTILEERQRLARDLHDAVSQSLFSSTIVAEALLQGKEPKSDRLKEQLEYVLRLNRGAQAEMRALLLELRPAHLTDVNLPNQIRGLVEAVRGRKEIDIELHIDDGVPMPPDIQIAFYRIAQEALNNIVKHSRAKRVEIWLISNEECVRLDVKDDGRGIDLNNVRKGMGLSNMRERAEEIDADFHIQSALGQGTTISVTWMRKEEA